MAVSGQGFTSFVANMVAQARAAATVALDTSVGSIPLALMQSVGGACLWLQGLVLQVLAQSRASTSVGADLDSWMADFSFARLGAKFSSGQAVFSRFVPTNQAIIPVGALVATGVGGVQYAVTADPTNPAYSPNALGLGLGGFTIAAGVSSLAVLVTAVVAGSAGNIAPNTLAAILQPISQVDTVGNTALFNGGTDAEADVAYRVRFQAFILQLFKSTNAAIAFAIAMAQQGLTWNILENRTVSGMFAPGSFVVIVDDGSGNPPTSLLNAVGTLVDRARALGVTFSVTGPSIVTANVAMTLVSANTSLHGADITAAQTAVVAYLNSLPVAQNLSFSRLYQVVYDSSSNISDVTGLTVNSATADLTMAVNQVVKSGTVVAV
jgi:uncharacterized phage protein gp47/JayE